MKKTAVAILLFAAAVSATTAEARKTTPETIYRKGWIDFNKNGRMDPYEDPSRSLDERVEDLLGRMTLEEKSCQLATLYGYGRVLRDSLPTAEWKNEVWKDGIANIDEMLNGVGKSLRTTPHLVSDYTGHVEAKNTIQRWFVEQTRLGIPAEFTNEGIHGLNHSRSRRPSPSDRPGTGRWCAVRARSPDSKPGSWVTGTSTPRSSTWRAIPAGAASWSATAKTRS